MSVHKAHSSGACFACTVSDWSEAGVLHEHLRLMHGTHELQGSDMLAACGIGDNAVVRVALRLCGGAKSKSKGGKNHKKKARVSEQAKELIFKEDCQLYAQVLATLGGCRLRVLCDDGKERLCAIRGTLRKRAWVGVGDVVLVSVRECCSADDVCDMIGKYTAEEARTLQTYEELPACLVPKNTTDDNVLDATGQDEVVFTWDGDIDNI